MLNKIHICIPRMKYVRGNYDLVVVTPPRPQTLHRSRDNLKNPYRIASIFISRGAEGPGREILQRPPSVCPSRLVFAL